MTTIPSKRLTGRTMAATQPNSPRDTLNASSLVQASPPMIDKKLQFMNTFKRNHGVNNSVLQSPIHSRRFSAFKLKDLTISGFKKLASNEETDS